MVSSLTINFYDFYGVAVAIHGKLLLMSIYASLFNFSHTHCVSICSFLVPFSLFVTFGSIYHVVAKHRPWRLYSTVSLASLAAALMFFHVWSWWAIGVVMGPTYILSAVAVVCLLVNGWAIGHSRSMVQVFDTCISIARTTYARRVHS